MKIKNLIIAFVLLPVFLPLVSCRDTSRLEKDLDDISVRLDSIEHKVSAANSNSIALGKFIKGNILIVGQEASESGYKLSLSNGTTISVTYGDKASKIIPIVSVDVNGNWICSFDGGKTFSPIKGSDNVNQQDGKTPLIGIDSGHYWIFSLDGGATWNRATDSSGRPMSAVDGPAMAGKASVFANVVYMEESSEMEFTLQDGRKIKVPVLNSFYLNIKGFVAPTKMHLNEKLIYEVEASDVADAIIKAPEGWQVQLSDKEFVITGPSSGVAGECQVDILIVSSKNYIKNIPLKFTLVPVAVNTTDCKQWNDFVAANTENVLLDFSYAGYNHGESAPGDVYSMGYKVYDVTDYGAVPNDGKSDREAFIAAYQAAIGAGKVQNPSARAIIYFPEGEFILHTSADDDGGKSKTIWIRAGDIVLKGAGRDKTIIVMQDPSLPETSALYSSPVMIDFKHFSGLTELTTVTSNAPKGSFSLEVASASDISEGDWVCLALQNNSSELIAEELAPYSVESGMKDILQQGVKVWDYHKVKSVSGNKITFFEPIMREVASKWGWKILKYPHYENVGIEDLTFKGNAKPDFVHHGSWQDDGAYKPVSMTRITDGWMRRVRFTSVSEACTITNSANVSVYDVIIDGNRGHSAIRSQVSSRVFIGAVTDKSSGNLVNSKVWQEGAGQYHACGVSKPSIGTVIWRNEWGFDSCFESHATQPRATLIDCCKGGWMQYRQGGDEAQVPNHLGDLTIWNFESRTSFSGTWKWWSGGKWWKFLPPVIVGFHGEACAFDPDQTKIDSYHGSIVEPGSLYEAQLRLRLGYVPAWLNSLKTISNQ